MPLIGLSKEIVEAMKKKRENLQIGLRETVKMHPKTFYKKDLEKGFKEEKTS